jgi:tetratricopeptide (TPR) repeat protein
VDILKQLGRDDESIDIWYIIFCNSEESLDAWDRKRIEYALLMVQMYELQGSLKKAEDILRNLQTALAAATQTSAIDRVHSAYIQMTVELARFFSRHERKADSSKLLLEIWRVYERSLDAKHAHDTDLLGGLKTVGDILMELDMLSDAERVLNRLWQFYKDNMQGSSQAAILVILALSRCHQKQRDDSKEEQTLRDIFEVLITQSVIDGTTTSVCIELASFYSRMSRWSEAVDITSRLLIRLWDAVLRDTRPPPTLPKQLPEDAIKLATNLASYYMKMSRATDAEGIYQFVFLSCRADLPLSDPHILNAVDQLAKFYETTKVVDKAISVLIQLKNDARTALGLGHKVYIDICYRLARLYEAHHRPEVGKAYGDIFKDCGGHHSHGGLDGDRAISIEAILALIRLYEKQRQVSELITWYETLWRLFQEHGKDTGLDMKTYFEIFVRYIATIEQTRGLGEAIRLAEELRSACIYRYGGQHIYTIRAILELAQMLEKDESHHEEATRLYEMIIRLHLEDYADQVEIERLILISRERLASLFSCHNHTMPSAQVIWVEIWEDSKKRYGCSHPKTLDYLSKMIAFFATRKTADSTALALKMLQTAVMEILEQERDDRRLFDVAVAVCEMYVLLQSQDAGFELLQDIRRDFSSTTSGRATLDRRSFIFVLALEELLRGNKSSTLFGDVSRDLMTETTLYESWMRALQYGGSLEARLSIGARLIAFLDSKRRTLERNRVEEELWTIFYKELKAESARTGILWDLFQICLKEVKKDGPAMPLFEAATNAVRTYYLQGNFRQSFDLATWLVGFVEQRGGWNSKDLSRLGLKLAFLLAGRESRASLDIKVPDRQLDADMRNLSKRIIVQIFKPDSLPKDKDFGSMDLEDIRLLVQMLSTETRLLEVSPLLIVTNNTNSVKDHSPQTLVHPYAHSMGRAHYCPTRRAVVRSPLRSQAHGRSYRPRRRHLLQPERFLWLPVPRNAEHGRAPILLLHRCREAGRCDSSAQRCFAAHYRRT